jgi:hypothetical protein
MRTKRKIIALLIIIAILTIFQQILPYHPSVINFYDVYIYAPFQAVKNSVFQIIPISIGDLLYVTGLILLLITVGKWIYFLFRFRTHKQFLASSVLNTLIVIGCCYIVFFLGWGGNYYKPTLTTYWDLDKTKWESDSSLIKFDNYLVSKLNAIAPTYSTLSFKEIDERAEDYFKKYTVKDRKMYGLNVKPSMFGYLMQHVGIQGYYNPFTGEAQVNKFLPAYMLPFVACHEMAHQAGIAAEDDANLLAYALSQRAPDPVFNYSAYFNLWLYTNARLRVTDTAMANKCMAMLNPLSRSHLDTLREIRNRYKSEVSIYSGHVYDGYLKLHHQKEGIESYNRVAITAWAWEQKMNGKDTLLALP